MFFLRVTIVTAAGTGCSLPEKAVTATGKLASKTVSATGKATGKLAVASVRAGGKVAASAGRAAGRALLDLAKAGTVTFVDAATGVVDSIPFVKGMKLSTALKEAKFDPRFKLFEIVRSSEILKFGWKQLVGDRPGPTLESGDVIRVVQLAVK